VAVTVLAVGGGSLLLSRAQERTFVTPIGGHTIVTLSDGTSIELNTDTVVRATMNGAQRSAVLEKGEAYFRVKHDPAHPFKVAVGSRQITVLGTKFTVRKDRDAVRVALIEGRVQFATTSAAQTPGAAPQSTVLKPGDVLLATATSLIVTHETKPDLANALGWRRGVLVFDHTSLADVAREYNRYNAQQIVIADSVTARLSMSGTMPTNDIAEFTSIARTVFGLRVRNKGGDVVISR